MGAEHRHPQPHPDPQKTAEVLLEAEPRLMRLTRSEAQADGSAGALTTTQLRVLRLLMRDLQITPATASEVVDVLARRGLV